MIVSCTFRKPMESPFQPVKKLQAVPATLKTETEPSAMNMLLYSVPVYLFKKMTS